MKISQPSIYRSYILRLWRDNPGASWQASLQSTATERIYHFGDIKQLWVFLSAQMEGDREDSKDAGMLPDEPEETGLD